MVTKTVMYNKANVFYTKHFLTHVITDTKGNFNLLITAWFALEYIQSNMS